MIIVLSVNYARAADQRGREDGLCGGDSEWKLKWIAPLEFESVVWKCFARYLKCAAIMFVESPEVSMFISAFGRNATSIGLHCL